MKKLYLTLILIFVLALALALSLSADSGVYDELDALSDYEEQEVESALKRAARDTGFSFYVGIVSNANNYSSFVSRYSLDDNNTVILLVDWYYGEYSYVMHTFGKAQSRFSVSEENAVLDSPEVYNAIKSGRLKDGLCSFASQARDACMPSWGTLIIVSAIVLLVTGGIFVAVVVSKYRKRKRGSSYPFDKFTTVDMTDCSDIFVTKTITRYRYRSSSSSSGGSSGGGGGRARSSSRR